MGAKACCCRVLLTVVSAVSAAFAANADSFTLKNLPRSLADWKDGDFYAGGVAPSGSPEDEIVCPSDAVVSVDGSDDDLMEFLSGFKVIYVKNSRLSVTVPSESTAVLGCAVRYDADALGTLEKLGGGELQLTAWRKLSSEGDSPDDYAVNIHVKEGVLRLPDTSHSTSKTYWNMFGLITVDEGAKLITITQSVLQSRGLHGGGTVTNECDSDCTMYVTSNWFPKEPFYGVIGGKISLMLRGNAYLDLAGTNNTYVSSTKNGLDASQANPVAYVAKFGANADEPSSIGMNPYIASYSTGMRIVYTGEGETTHKRIYALSSPSYLDAGANGGVTFAGDFGTWSTSGGNLQRYLVLDGSNRNECVISGEFDPNGWCSSANGTNHWYIAKRGTGTWRFTEDDHKHLVGSFAVENGTLAFDSVFQQGVACALGTSTRTYSFHYGDLDETKRWRYAFELGSSTNSGWTGMMEYRGAAAAQCLDRPFALVGCGGFSANSGAGPVKYADVTGVGEGAKTLVLDGDSPLTNSVYNVYDGEGTVSVSKRGGGTWLLGGDVDVSGSVEVLGGTLVVKREPQRYTRYRFTLKEIAGENAVLSEKYAEAWAEHKNWGFWGFNEIGLYDENGHRQNFQLSECSNRAALAPGEAAFATDRPVGSNSANQTIERLFDGVRKFVMEDGVTEVWNGFVGYVDQNNPPNRSRPDSWIAIDMYLTNGAPVITHYDIANTGVNRATTGGRTASAFSIYGSVDGVNWDLLSSEFDEITDVPASNYNWLWSQNAYNDSLDPIPTTSHMDGWKLKKTVPDREFKLLDEVGSVTVANGGELKFEGTDAPVISSLKLFADEAGAISGFSFAEDGTLEISGNVPDEGLRLPVSLGGSSGLANFRSWIVRINGKDTFKNVRADASGLSVTPKGLTLSVR